MFTLSVIIITMNEENRIRRCLESVKDIANEIIVVDSGSTDNTVEIVKEYTDLVEVTDWPGYGPQKQRALNKATCDWVLSIDSDEALDNEMLASIKSILNQESISETSFHLPWKNIFLAQAIKHGRSSRAPKRLFKREGSSFSLDMVHEKVIIEGKSGKIDQGYLLHYSIKDFEHLLEKNRKYSWLTSEKYFNQKKKSRGVYVAVLRGLLTFVQIYLFRLGFLDGSRGLLLAMMFAQRSFNKYAGVWYLEQAQALKNKQDQK